MSCADFAGFPGLPCLRLTRYVAHYKPMLREQTVAARKRVGRNGWVRAARAAVALGVHVPPEVHAGHGEYVAATCRSSPRDFFAGGGGTSGAVVVAASPLVSDVAYSPCPVPAA